MDVIEYLKIEERICGFYTEGCQECPLSSYNNGAGTGCSRFIKQEPEKCIEIMKKWTEEHPVRTRQSEFLKMFPNASLDSNGSVDICPKATDLVTFSCDDGAHGGCLRCRQRYWQQEVKDEPLD